MSDPDARDRLRADFLLSLYEATDGETLNKARVSDIAAPLDLTEDQALSLMRYLSDRGLGAATLTWDGMDALASLTASGVDEAERMMRERGENQSPAAAPVAVTLTIDEQRQVEAFLHTFTEAVENGTVKFASPEDEADADAQVATMTHQLRSPRPLTKVMAFCAAQLHAITQGVAGNAVFAGVQWLIQNVT